MNRGPRKPARPGGAASSIRKALWLVASFAAGLMVQTTLNPTKPLFSTMFQQEEAQQASYCSDLASNPHEGMAGFHYVGVDNVQLGLGAAGLKASMFVYDGADIVSNSIRQTGVWERDETREIIGKLELFQQVGGEVTCARKCKEAQCQTMSMWTAGHGPE